MNGLNYKFPFFIWSLDFSNIQTIWWYLKLALLSFSTLRNILIDKSYFPLERKILPHAVLHVYPRLTFLLCFDGVTLTLPLAKFIHMTCTANITLHANYAIILMKSTISSAFVLNCTLRDGKITTGNGVKKNNLAGKQGFHKVVLIKVQDTSSLFYSILH